jgi:hypothetical protein
MVDPKLKYQFVAPTDYESVRGPDWPSYVDFTQHQSVPEWVYQEIDSMLTVKEHYDPESFCVLPWHSQEIDWNGKSTHCCLLPKTYNIKVIKSNMLQGIKPSECQKCWNLEQQGLLSDRKLKNSALDFWSGQDLQTIVKESTVDSGDTQILKLTTSYTCNSACVTCNSSASSFWNTVERRIDNTIPIKKYSFIDVEAIKTQVDFKNLKILSLLGGEPLLEKNNFVLLQHLIDIGNTDVFVTIITNGSVKLSEKHVELFSSFPNLNFCISIDGIGPVFEYLRWPLKWPDIVTNLDQYRCITNNISVSYTISNLNILYYANTVDWFRAHDLAWNHNVVYEPSYFSPMVLPSSAKKTIKNLLNAKEFDAFVGNKQEVDTELWQRFQQEIKIQDSAKGISIHNYLPEFCDLVGLINPT